MLQTAHLTVDVRLGQIVKNIWLVTNRGTCRKEKMIPFGCMDLVYVEAGELTYHGDEEKHFKTHDLFITGQVSKPYFMEYGRGCKVIGIGFYPHTAHLCFHEKAGVFTDQCYRLDEVLTGWTQLHESLALAKIPGRKAWWLQQLLLRQIQDHGARSSRQNLSKLVLQMMFAQQAKLDLPDVCRRYQVSQRYLQQAFQECVGLRPKMYQKVVRFLNTLATHQRGVASLTELALSCGYFDQSHFIRDFKQFTQVAPKTYFNAPHDLLEDFTSDERGSLLYNSIR